MKAADRQERDAEILRLFVAGATYRQIAAVTGVGLTSVDRIVKRELANSAQRRAMLTDEALALYQERQERLFQAHWPKALKGDYRSAEICRRMLDQQARLYGLYSDNSLTAPTPTSPLGGDDDGEEQQDDLARLRAARSSA